MLAVPGDSVDDEALEPGYRPRPGPLGVRVVRLGPTGMENRRNAVAAAGINEDAVHRLVTAAAAGEIEILGVSDGEVVADEPALGGADKDDVVAGGHAGDDAVALGGVALKEVDGEQAAGGVHGESLGEVSKGGDEVELVDSVVQLRCFMLR